MYDIINYIVVDDDELDRFSLLQETAKYPFLHKVAVCSNSIEALEQIKRFRPEILFTDIEMPGGSGLELMRTLSGKIPVPVFITSHPEFALESYNLEVFDYILKPLNTERFAKCMTRIEDFFRLRKKVMDIENNHNDTGYIMVKQGYERHRLHHSDIVFLEAMKDYTKIRTLSGQNLLVLETISSLLRKLPEDKFLRIHRSYAVNEQKIESVAHQKVYIQGMELPVGKSHKNALGKWNQ
jgi:two-component system LytT family response regulator